MKKSSLILLTIVATLTISSCAAQETTNNEPFDPVYGEQMIDTDTTRYHQDTTIQQPVYNYYYRSYFWDDMFRVFFPQRYYTIVSRPGFVPHRLRHEHLSITHYHSNRTGNHSNRRGGFGHHGSFHAVVS